MQLPKLPIYEVIDQLRKRLKVGSAVLTAPPGSGKTTLVPLMLLREPWLRGRKIIILEPRRLAARAAAQRMADLLGESVGQTVGYQIRFQRKISKQTRIEVLTEGILTRRIQADPALEDIGLLIFDEYHERSIHADLALALALEVCQLRDDLRLLVMSATLDAQPIAELLGGVEVIEGEGQNFEVAVAYRRIPAAGSIGASVTEGVRQVLCQRDGDILAFLPGRAEIREVRDRLTNLPEFADIRILPLFGDLSREKQNLAIYGDDSGNRRVVLATAVAETSLTIEGIGCVVDSGWSRRPLFDPNSGLTRLTTVRVSQAAARQRTGRAGRLGPGYCLRLWTRQEHGGLLPFHPPEIVSADLAPLVLELALWGVIDYLELRWLDPPRSGAYLQARELLHSLGAVDENGKITKEGKILAAIPAHPRLASILLKARAQGVGALAADLCAVVAERDLLPGGLMPSAELRRRLEVLHNWRKDGNETVWDTGVDPGACRHIDRVSASWCKKLDIQRGEVNLDKVGNLMVYGFPDRIAKRRQKKSSQYLLAGGRGVSLMQTDPLAANEYLVVANLDGGRRDGRIYLAEPVQLEELENNHSHLFTRVKMVFWDEGVLRVLAIERISLGKIIITEKPLPDVSSEDIAAAMHDGIRQMGLGVLPWTRDVQQLQARIALLSRMQEHDGWPDLSDEHLQSDWSWLQPYLLGMRKKEDLQSLDMLQILHDMLGWERKKIVDMQAPTKVTVPSGSTIRLNYQMDGPPILAVRIQEMYGLAETPTICRGRVGVLLHLLSPARRVVQVTDDLNGFWQRGYGEVRKELQGRYVKHYWPEDPLAAQPLRGVKRRTL